MVLSWFRPARSYSGRPWLDSQRRMHQPCKSDNSDEPWVPEGQSGRNFWGAFLKSGRTRGPGKALQNVGGEVRTPGAGPTSKMYPNKSGQTAFRYPGTLEPEICDFDQTPTYNLPLMPLPNTPTGGESFRTSLVLFTTRFAPTITQLYLRSK